MLAYPLTLEDDDGTVFASSGRLYSAYPPLRTLKP